MLGSVNVLPQYNKNILLLLSAVYYRNYALLWSCVVVAGQVSWPNVWISAITVRNRNFGTLFNQELWISLKVGIRNSSGYTCMGIINIQYILRRPLTKYLRCPLFIPTISSMSIVHINHCWHQPFPIPKLINIKVDHPMLSNKQILGSNKCLRCWTRRVLQQGSICSFLLAESRGVYLFIYIPNFHKGLPSIWVESR